MRERERERKREREAVKSKEYSKKVNGRKKTRIHLREK